MPKKYKLILALTITSILFVGCSLGKTDYLPSEEIQEKARVAVEDYLDQLDHKETGNDIHNEIHASDFKLIGMQKVPCSETDINVWEAYIWQYESGYSKENLEVNICGKDLSKAVADTGFSIPAKITLEEDKNGEFKAVQIDRPSDLDYSNDMEELFPEAILDEMDSFQASDELTSLNSNTMQKACEIFTEKTE